MKVITYIIILLFSSSMYGQNSLDVLTYDEFIEQVMIHHPTAFKASNIEQRGEASILSARGQFDPKLFGDINQKIF